VIDIGQDPDCWPSAFAGLRNGVRSGQIAVGGREDMLVC
jgi:hypothetical protein